MCVSSTLWGIYVSLNWAIVDSGYGLLPAACLTIAWTNTGSISKRLIEMNKNYKKDKHSHFRETQVKWHGVKTPMCYFVSSVIQILLNININIVLTSALN